jgi:dipeptidyl-peptidase 4
VTRVCLLVLLLAPAFAQKKPITLETIEELNRKSAAIDATWSPDGKSFVYPQESSLIVYDCVARTSKTLVSTDAFDAAAVKPASGQPYEWEDRYAHDAALEWSFTGKEILYSDAGDLFLIHVENGKWDQLTKTPEVEHDAKFSPDAKSVAFRRNYDLYVLDLASAKETRLTTNGSESLRNGGLDWVYPEELNLATAFWWSPDSSSIAYLQFDVIREPTYPHADLLPRRALYEPQRYPQVGENNADVHLGIVPAAGGATKWLDVGETRDSWLIARAGWMPDSKSVYAIRMNRIQNHLEMFSIEIASQSRRAIFEESDPYWINLAGEVEFLADQKHFLWTSERDGGFRHIFLYSNDGKNVKQLTRGAWEVRDISGHSDGSIFYVSDEGSALETHLYSIKLDGSGKRQLDAAAGTHTVSMGPGAPFYLDTFSSLADPPRSKLYNGAGAEVAVIRDADRQPLEQYDVRPTEIVEFRTSEGITLHGRVIKPANFEPGKKYPAIVDVYGGPGVGSVQNEWAGIGVDQVLANKGYVIWQSENRGITGRGHAFETPIFHQLGVIELADQLAGVRHLISLGFVDPEQVAIHGWSFGGFMTLNALLNAPEIFRCGIAGAPVTNFINYDTIYTERYMGLPADDAEGYARTALPPKAANLKGKLMIAHNLNDDNVLFQNTMQLIDALENAGKQFELMLYPQKTHGVAGDPAKQLNATMLDFFDRNLK